MGLRLSPILRILGVWRRRGQLSYVHIEGRQGGFIVAFTPNLPWERLVTLPQATAKNDPRNSKILTGLLVLCFVIGAEQPRERPTLEIVALIGTAGQIFWPLPTSCSPSAFYQQLGLMLDWVAWIRVSCAPSFNFRRTHENECRLHGLQ
jgi:hypothetical protein